MLCLFSLELRNLPARQTAPDGGSKAFTSTSREMGARVNAIDVMIADEALAVGYRKRASGLMTMQALTEHCQVVHYRIPTTASMRPVTCSLR